MSETVVVHRPIQDPPELRRQAGSTPARTFLIDVISRHPTFEGAAKQLGVSLVTLRRWRRRYGIEVA